VSLFCSVLPFSILLLLFVFETFTTSPNQKTPPS